MKIKPSLKQVIIILNIYIFNIICISRVTNSCEHRVNCYDLHVY